MSAVISELCLFVLCIIENVALIPLHDEHSETF